MFQTREIYYLLCKGGYLGRTELKSWCTMLGMTERICQSCVYGVENVSYGVDWDIVRLLGVVVWWFGGNSYDGNV